MPRRHLHFLVFGCGLADGVWVYLVEWLLLLGIVSGLAFRDFDMTSLRGVVNSLYCTLNFEEAIDYTSTDQQGLVTIYATHNDIAQEPKYLTKKDIRFDEMLATTPRWAFA